MDQQKDDLIDTKRQETREEKARKRHDRDLSDIRFGLKHPEVRRIFTRIMDSAFLRTFTSDTNTTMFNEGRRSVSLDFLYDLLEAKPEAYTQLVQEYQAEKKSEENLEKQEIKDQSDLV